MRKYEISKTASAYGRFNRARFAYNPVSGDRKSGMPAEVLIPAPVCKREVLDDAEDEGGAYHDDDLLDILVFDILGDGFDVTPV